MWWKRTVDADALRGKCPMQSNEADAVFCSTGEFSDKQPVTSDGLLFYLPMCSCESMMIINRRCSCGFCPSFVTTIIHEHTAAGGGYQQSRN